MNIGLILPIRQALFKHYSDMRNMAILAESVGFDSLWLYDHFFYQMSDGSTTGAWECWTFLTALAEATKHIKIGTLVSCTQFRSPALLAKMAVTLDEVSNGRLILGLGAGWNEKEFKALGVPYDQPVGRFEEALQIITTLLRKGQIDFKGKYYQVVECEIKPQGPRLDGPPIIVGGEGPRILRLAALYANGWNTGYLNFPQSFVKPISTFTQICKKVGREISSIEITGLVALHYPDLGIALPLQPGESYLIGSTEEISRILYQYEQLTVKHLIIYFMPCNFTALIRLSEAMNLYRSMSNKNKV